MNFGMLKKSKMGVLDSPYSIYHRFLLNKKVYSWLKPPPPNVLFVRL